jgi:carboxyl-terminal processing protease
MKKTVGFIILNFYIICISFNSYSEVNIDYDYINSFKDYINENYQGHFDEAFFIENTVSGMFNSLDLYSEFYTKDELQYMMDVLNGVYEGIGVEIESINDKIIIVGVKKDSPSEESGLEYGDEIVMVDNRKILGKSAYEVTKLIKGEENTSVILTIKREEEGTNLEFNVVRKSLDVNPVEYKIINNKGYLKLSIFSANASENVYEVLKYFKSKNIKKIIFDLRDNPGGELDQAVRIASYLLPKNNVITKLNFYNENTEDEEFSSDNIEFDFTTNILVNNYSASASEILTAAIQDNGMGYVIGDTTYGKAKVQRIFPMLTLKSQEKFMDKLGYRIVNAFDLPIENIELIEDDDILGWAKLTVGQYESPLGQKIDGNGIIPNYLVENDENSSYQLNLINLMRVRYKYNLNSSGIDIYNLEKVLSILGYKVDSPDLILDEKTFNAIKSFQKDNNLYPYGILDYTTQKTINKKFIELTDIYDKQLEKAIKID